jgi:uncharacterized protein
VHFEIPASDMAKLSKFYAECFGWKFEKVPIPDTEYWMISTGPQAKSVGGGMYKKTGAKDSPRNYVSVDDIDTAIKTFKRAGGSEMMGKQEIPGGGWTFIGADPEGNIVGLHQAAKRVTRAPKTKSRKKQA